MYYIIVYIYYGTLTLISSLDWSPALAFHLSPFRSLPLSLSFLACSRKCSRLLQLWLQAIFCHLPSTYRCCRCYCRIINVTQAARTTSPPNALRASASLRSIPAIFLDHVRQFNNELALLVLLAGLVGVLIFPAERRLAALTVNISDRMQASEQDTLLRLPAGHIHHRIEQICRSLATLKRLWDELVVWCQMCTAMNTWVGPICGR